MEVFEAVRTVLAVRSYQDKPVPAAAVQRIVEAAWLTGSSKNAQPWHFIVVDDRETLRRLADLSPTSRGLTQAPVAVVVAIERTKFSESDAGRAIQSMVLTAWSEGIGSNWTGFLGLDKVNPVLGIPKDVDVIGIVPFGYPSEVRTKGRKRRKPLSEVAHRGRFGQPFA